MKIKTILNSIQYKRIKITNHAVDETENDELTFDEVYFSVFHGKIIEDYPDDKPYPSCLIYGKTFNGNPVHSVWAYNEENQWSVLITVYRPNPKRWINWERRRVKK